VLHFLAALQNFQAAAPALALERIGGIGHELKFAEHELRNDDRAVEKERVGDVGHAPVNNHASIQHFERVLQAALGAEQSAERLKIQHVAFVRAEDQAHVGHHQKNGQAEEGARAFGHGCVREHERGEIGSENSEDRSRGRPDQPPQARAAQAHLEQNHREREEQARERRGLLRQAERLEMIARCDAHGDEHEANREHVPEGADAFLRGARRCDISSGWIFRWRASRRPARRVRRPLHLCTL